MYKRARDMMITPNTMSKLNQFTHVWAIFIFPWAISSATVTTWIESGLFFTSSNEHEH